MDTTQVLLVSPEQEIRAWLEEAGLSVFTVTSASAALKALEDKRFEVLITELVVEVSSGLDLIRQAQTLQNDLKSIVLAAQATLNSVLKAIHLHVNDYLIKPWSRDQLLTVVRNLLQDEAPRPQAEKRIDSLLEITSILYQVNNLELAAQMILETYTEFIGIPAAALAMPAEEDGNFRLFRVMHLPEEYQEQAVFNLRHSVDGKHISTDKASWFSYEILAQNGIFPSLQKAPSWQTVQFYPVKFQENLVAFMVLFYEESGGGDEQQNRLMEVMAQQIGPVLASFEVNKKSGNSYENIISKIVKDRVHEARLMLNPVSFAVLRIVYKDQFVDSLVLEDAMRQYQAKFHKKFEGKGDLIWLTADTAFVILPFIDLFMAESLATELKEDISLLCVHDQAKASFELKYACISYPQSGESSQEIINNLWLRLFEAIYFMQS